MTGYFKDTLKVVNIILEMEGSFTCDDAQRELAKHSVNMEPLLVKKALTQLCENGYLKEIDKRYTVATKRGVRKEPSKYWKDARPIPMSQFSIDPRDEIMREMYTKLR